MDPTTYLDCSKQLASDGLQITICNISTDVLISYSPTMYIFEYVYSKLFIFYLWQCKSQYTLDADTIWTVCDGHSWRVCTASVHALKTGCKMNVMQNNIKTSEECPKGNYTFL